MRTCALSRDQTRKHDVNYGVAVAVGEGVGDAFDCRGRAVSKREA